jgi:surfactin synthase thioesterase subunit
MLLTDMAGRDRVLGNVVCFPYAGGAPSLFRTWPADIPGWANLWAVNLGGRERRLREPAKSDLKEQVDELVEAVAPLARLPLLLYGHSVGAVLAAHVAQELFPVSGAPAALIVAASPSPWYAAGPQQDPPQPPLSDLTGERLRKLAQETLGLDESVVGRPEWLELFELLQPALRADLAIAECEPYLRERAIAGPVHVLYGADDTAVGRDAVAGWTRLTSGPTSVAAVRGGHFFVRSEPSLVPDVVMPALVSTVRSGDRS